MKVIRVNECWECGVPRAFTRADEAALGRVRKRAWELRRTEGLPWAQAWSRAQEEVGVRVMVVSRRYCGC
jgi:hypothetical protein